MITYQNQRCLVRESKKIRTLLNKRFNELELTGKQIYLDAKNNGRKFNEQTLSRYRKHGNVVNTLSASDIIWLCDKYSIKLTLKADKK